MFSKHKCNGCSKEFRFGIPACPNEKCSLRYCGDCADKFKKCQCGASLFFNDFEEDDAEDGEENDRWFESDNVACLEISYGRRSDLKELKKAIDAGWEVLCGTESYIRMKVFKCQEKN